MQQTHEWIMAMHSLHPARKGPWLLTCSLRPQGLNSYECTSQYQMLITPPWIFHIWTGFFFSVVEDIHTMYWDNDMLEIRRSMKILVPTQDLEPEIHASQHMIEIQLWTDLYQGEQTPMIAPFHIVWGLYSYFMTIYVVPSSAKIKKYFPRHFPIP